MAKVVNIVVNVDQDAFINDYKQRTPNPDRPNGVIQININNIPDLSRRIKMIALDSDTFSGQGSSDLAIKVESDDSIRWYEMPIQPSPVYSLLIKDISPLETGSDRWADFMENFKTPPATDYCVSKMGVMMRAYYSSDNLLMFSGNIDYTEAHVKRDLPRTKKGVLSYNMVFELIRLIEGVPTVVVQYLYDPKIYINQ